jgi:hypothetical protein
MPFIYTRNEDNQIMGVFEVKQTTPAGHTEHEEPWYNNGPWWVRKIIRNGPGDYFDTGISQPDDNDGLMIGDV